MANIIIVDDHALYRLGVRTALSLGRNRHSVVGEAATSAELFKLLETVKPDLVLLDIILPDVQGDEIARRLKRDFPDIKILVLSSETSEDAVLEMVEIGVEGFIAKDGAQGDLSEAIRVIMAGEQFFGSKISEILNSLLLSSRKKRASGPADLFSCRELEVIDLCCKGLVSKEIAERLSISVRTVETHKANIFEKLGISNSVELARYAFKSGLVKL